MTSECIQSLKEEFLKNDYIAKEKAIVDDVIKTEEETSVKGECKTKVKSQGLDSQEQDTSKAKLSGYDGFMNLAIMMGALALLKVLLRLSLEVFFDSDDLSNQKQLETDLPLHAFFDSDVPTLAPVVPTDVPLPVPFLIFPFIAFFLVYRVELLIAESRISFNTALPFYMAIIFTILTLPVVGLGPQDHLHGLISNLLICVSYIVLSMKLISYIQVNKGYREELKNSNNNVSSVYPNNLTLWNITYFWFSPNLIYNPVASRTTAIRPKFMMVRAVELFFLQVVLRSLALTIRNVVGKLVDAEKNEDFVLVIERFLTLSFVIAMAWIVCAYFLFVSFLQLSAELFQVQERQFFYSWWNASTIEEFWRSWNLPVHRWCVKHIYLPIVKSGWSKTSAITAVFFTSAILHEYFISCPMHVTGYFAFLVFVGQLPLSYISEIVVAKYGRKVGNFLVWGVIVFGNSVGTIVYYKSFKNL